MTWKDEFLILWILCAVVVTFVARHFFGGALYLMEHVAAFSAACAPGLLHLLVARLR